MLSEGLLNSDARMRVMNECLDVWMNEENQVNELLLILEIDMHSQELQ